MTKGDRNKFSIPTEYNGIMMRSKLEASVARFLDGLLIKWLYEPQTYKLKDGTFLKPDFYLTELKMWVEVKGDLQGANLQPWRDFAKDGKTEVLMLNGSETRWFSTKDFIDGFNDTEIVLIGKCSKCSSYFFVSVFGSYHCRKCGNYDGDHDIIGSFSSKENKIKFHNKNAVDNELWRLFAKK